LSISLRRWTAQPACAAGIAAACIIAACDAPVLSTDPSTRITSVTVDSTAGAIHRSVFVSLDRSDNVEVTFGASGTAVLTLASNQPAVEHRFDLPRLRAGREYRLEVAVAGSARPPLRTEFRTGDLPAELAAFSFSVSGTPSRALALLELAGSTAFYGMLIVEDGEIVGYLPSSGSLFGSTRRANGDIVLLDGQLGLIARRLDGTIVYRLPQPADGAATPYGRIHHDVTATPANTLLFIANEARQIGNEQVVGEALWEWNPEAQTVTKRWSAFDHLDWQTERGSRSVAGNWLHANGISYGSRGNVIVSLRNVDQVISIAPDFSTVEWKLGGVNGTLTFDGERVLGQHYVSEPQPNRLLVYDNGFERASEPYTRVVEYRIDQSAGHAAREWEFRPVPAIYAALVGSAVRLPNGNTVVNFGMSAGHSDSTGPLTVMEVDGAGVERWRLTPTAGITRLYRATPVESLLGERPGQFRSP
jgi:hypothetical protein